MKLNLSAKGYIQIIKKFESSGLTNAESIGVFEMIKHDQLASIDKESKEDY